MSRLSTIVRIRRTRSIGATRAGKSTLINYLDGVEYELLEDDEETLVPKERKGNYKKLKCAGQYSTSSQTLYSEVIKIVKDNQVYHFADLPGFFDKNTAKNKSILAALGLPILIQKAENIKAIVFVLEYISNNFSGLGCIKVGKCVFNE